MLLTECNNFLSYLIALNKPYFELWVVSPLPSRHYSLARLLKLILSKNEIFSSSSKVYKVTFFSDTRWFLISRLFCQVILIYPNVTWHPIQLMDINSLHNDHIVENAKIIDRTSFVKFFSQILLNSFHASYRTTRNMSDLEGGCFVYIIYW